MNIDDALERLKPILSTLEIMLGYSGKNTNINIPFGLNDYYALKAVVDFAQATKDQIDEGKE